MTAAFDQIAQALATALNTDQASAGFLLGFVVIFIFLAFLGIAFGDRASGEGYLIFGVVGVMFDVIAGWWPLWTAFILALLIVIEGRRRLTGA